MTAMEMDEDDLGGSFQPKETTHTGPKLKLTIKRS